MKNRNALTSVLKLAAAYPNEPGVHMPPPRRGAPLLIRQWKYLWRAEFVELKRGPKVLDTGWVDDLTHDGKILWIQLSQGKGRKMIHNNEGIDVWRVDSRVYQDRDPDFS